MRSSSWLNIRKYINVLSKSHVRIFNHDDDLIWALTTHQVYSPKIGYPIIHVAHKPPFLEGWWSELGNPRLPHKLKYLCGISSWIKLLQVSTWWRDYTFVFLRVSFIHSTRNRMIMSSCSTEPYDTFWEQVLSSLDIPQRWEGWNINEAWND